MHEFLCYVRLHDAADAVLIQNPHTYTCIHNRPVIDMLLPLDHNASDHMFILYTDVCMHVHTKQCPHRLAPTGR